MEFLQKSTFENAVGARCLLSAAQIKGGDRARVYFSRLLFIYILHQALDWKE